MYLLSGSVEKPRLQGGIMKLYGFQPLKAKVNGEFIAKQKNQIGSTKMDQVHCNCIGWQRGLQRL
jgi:hypothetical protein